MTNFKRAFMMYAVLAVIIMLLSYAIVETAIKRQVEYTLSNFVATHVEPNYREYMLEANIDEHIAIQIQAALHHYSAQLTDNEFLISNLSLSLVDLRSDALQSPLFSVNWHSVDWMDNGSAQTVTFDSQLALYWWPLFIASALVSLIIAVVEAKLTERLASLRANSNTTDPDLTSSNPAPSHQAPLDPAELFINLNCKDFSVSVNQQSVALTKTQFLYLLWYAQKRQQGIDDGWILNPHADKPCPEKAQELLTLMSLHNGHQRAINELTKYGLRAKTLDQNRNKIKDVFSSAAFLQDREFTLFDSVRDTKTGRYKHRLALLANNVTIL